MLHSTGSLCIISTSTQPSEMSLLENLDTNKATRNNLLSVSMSTTPDQIMQIVQNQSTWDSLSFLVSLSYIIVMNTGGVHCVLLRMCMEERFQAGHGVLCNGANQIVVRNSQRPLRTAERREELKGGGGWSGGTHWGPFTWWHSETDLAGSPCRCSHLCVWTLPSLFTYSTKHTQGFETLQHVLWVIS